jgi:hypothetical protein
MIFSTSALVLITVVGLAAIAGLGFLLVRAHLSDQLSSILKKRAPSARLAQRATFVEGIDEVPVVVTLTDRAFYYENPDLEAHFDLNLVEEIEYDDDLSTAKTHHEGKVLRLRSHGQAFEFVLPKNDAAKWMQALPPRRVEAPQRHAI